MDVSTFDRKQFPICARVLFFFLSSIFFSYEQWSVNFLCVHFHLRKKTSDHRCKIITKPYFSHTFACRFLLSSKQAFPLEFSNFHAKQQPTWCSLFIHTFWEFTTTTLPNYNFTKEDRVITFPAKNTNIMPTAY